VKLTFEEKVALLDGSDVWHTKVFEGVPSIMMADGPHGIRKQLESTDTLGLSGSVKATAFPTASLTACSFDRDLIAKMGKALATEAKANEVNMILGPGINMKRSPLCGRNFEYFSEDPYLAGELASAYVSSIEAEGIGTSVKHFFCNNQEKRRFTIDSVVDERALREIYLKAFERVIKENPASVMASYNKINGVYAVESPVLKSILRNEWKYDGIVVSDWGAINDRANSILATCDLEMPSSMGYQTNKVIQAAQYDEKLRNAVEDSAERMLKFILEYQQNFHETYDSQAHHQVARQIARESMVLLKNDGILPLNRDDKIAMIGGFAFDMRYQGGGSSHINPTKLDQLIDIDKHYSDHIIFSKGYGIKDMSEDDIHLKNAIKVAKEVDKVVLFVGLPDSKETEGFDRKTLDIPESHKQLIIEISKVNPNIVVVAVAGSVVNLDFEDQVNGILMAYLGGQASASAVLDLLYGIENPSGRLAETFIDDIQSCNVQLNNDNNATYYDESIYIGYRYYNTFKKEVRYPFGYGLSYTTFEYSNFEIQEAEQEFVISMEIKNVGQTIGKEVVQIYIENNKSSAYKAKRELKQFDKVEIEPGGIAYVCIKLPKSSFEYYDIIQRRFIIETGEYGILVSKNIEETIHEFIIKLAGESVNHQPLSYHSETYDTSDFKKIYEHNLPEKNIKIKRPFTLGSTLSDMQTTLIGRMVASAIIKEGLKETDKMKEEWLKEVAKETLLETPIRMLSLFSAGKFSLLYAEGVIDIINLKFIRGIRKIRRNAKENKVND